MSNIYVIQWKSKISGRSGRGTKLFSLEEAEGLVRELNRDYPNIQHELLEADSVTAAQSERSAAASPGSPESASSASDQPASETHAFSEISRN